LQRFAGDGVGLEKEQESKKFLRFLFSNKRTLFSSKRLSEISGDFYFYFGSGKRMIFSFLMVFFL
jgi:hypothetical protein